MSHLEENIMSVRERISAAATRAGRATDEITLVAVSKTQPTDAILNVYDLGLRHFGENRVEEAETKIAHLPPEITWHMIGHIQSRKAKRVIPIFDMIHSVDSLKLARRLDRLCQDCTTPVPVFLECNVSGEASKYGFEASRWTKDQDQRRELVAVAKEILSLPHIDIQGLMTMAPIVADPEKTRPVFARLRRVRDELATQLAVEWPHLSMGMTDDFEIAIEEGSTMVRVGRAIFSPNSPVCHI